MQEILPSKLYAVCSDEFIPGNAEGKSALINLTGDPYLLPMNDGRVYFVWSVDDDVDESAFSGVVRMCASIIKGSGQSVLIVGHQDTVDVFSACIVKEYLGCGSDIALGVLREGRSGSLTKSELIETVFKYEIS